MSLELKLMIDRYLGGATIFVLNIAARLLSLLARRDHSLPVRGDILVIKVLGGGSLVIALPALLGIRRKYPQAKMRLLTTGAAAPFAETLGIFDAILVLDDRSLAGVIVSGFRCLWACFGTDTVIDLEIYSYLSTVFSLLTFARNRLGFFFDETGFRQRLHTHRVFFYSAAPLYLYYDRMATLVGAPVASPDECAAQILKVLGVKQRTPNPQGRIAVHCNCSDLTPERKLAAGQWSRQVFAPAPDKHREVVFLGAKNDHKEAESVIAAVRVENTWQGKLSNLCGEMPLQDSLRILAGCGEFWGIDSSLLHYARLFGLRCKSFWGPTSPDMRLRPMSSLMEETFYRKTACSPCAHPLSRSPCRGDNLCMQWLFEPREKGDPRESWVPVVTDSRH